MFSILRRLVLCRGTWYGLVTAMGAADVHVSLARAEWGKNVVFVEQMHCGYV